ncbi:MAG: DUF805 domain-containing protein [Anaerolineales bacterium]|nr:DUF805 domain-containing protein [Anaerolineales bacterium]
MKWYLAVLKKYAVFSGRARRKEYWMFFLFNLIIAAVLGGTLGLIEVIAGIPSTLSVLLITIYTIAVIIPGLAVGVRRLHDTGKSGWWLLITLVPIIGAIVVLIFQLQDSQQGENQYGPNPKTAMELQTI